MDDKFYVLSITHRNQKPPPFKLCCKAWLAMKAITIKITLWAPYMDTIYDTAYKAADKEPKENTTISVLSLLTSQQTIKKQKSKQVIIYKFVCTFLMPFQLNSLTVS